MRFYGQEKIRKELNYILARAQSGMNMNILLSAPSGYGKTTLGTYIMSEIDPKGRDSNLSTTPDFNFHTGKRIHLVDEAHDLPDMEALYEKLDSHKYFMIVATNQMGNLLEPLVNRCLPLIFDKYNLDNIISIVKDRLSQFIIKDSILENIAIKAKGNPRVAEGISDRLGNIFYVDGVPEDIDILDNIFMDVLNIDKYGLNSQDRSYLEVLKKFGKVSLDLISSLTHLNTATITKFIEPDLIMAGRVKITAKGREYVPTTEETKIIF
jgi:Holliday junction DNA helicase RuvB